MKYPLNDEMLFIRGNRSFLIIAKATKRFVLFIETPEEEYCQTVDPHDLIVVSAPEGGSIDPAMMLIELVRTYYMPLLVLPAAHPGSRRISYVVSVGPLIHTNCSIQRGTHPEQHIICSADEFSGMILKGTKTGVDISPLPDHAVPQYLKYQMKAEYL